MNSYNDLFSLIGFNTIVVVFSTFILGIAAGYIGAFLILRKRALLSDALAHGALPGLCVAFIIGIIFFDYGRNLLLLLTGAAISGLFAILIIQFLVTKTRLKEDVALAAVLSVFFGLGIMLLSIIQNMESGQEGGLNHFIYGQTAAMGFNDAVMMMFVAILVIAICLRIHKELGLLCFDQEFAESLGLNVKILDLTLMSLVTLVIIVGLQAVGMLLVIAMLIIPPSTARFWTDNLKLMVILSSIFGGLSGIFGSLASSIFPNLPAGAVIVLVSGGLFLFSFFLSPKRGLLIGLYRSINKNLKWNMLN